MSNVQACKCDSYLSREWFQIGMSGGTKFKIGLGEVS